MVPNLSIEEGALGRGGDKVLKSLFWHSQELIQGAITELHFEYGSEGAVGERFYGGGVDSNPGHRRPRSDCTRKSF